MYRYYSTQRPITPGAIPMRSDIVSIKNFDHKKECEEIGCMAYGYVEYASRLTKKEISDYELVSAERKKWYCVTTIVYDNGKATAKITSSEFSSVQPENTFNSLRDKDIWNDWYDSAGEAEQAVNEVMED